MLNTQTKRWQTLLCLFTFAFLSVTLVFLGDFYSIKSCSCHYCFCSDFTGQLYFISLVTRFIHSEIPHAVCKHVSLTSVSLTSAVEVESDVKYGVKYSLYLMLVLATAQQRASQTFWEIADVECCLSLNTCTRNTCEV